MSWTYKGELFTQEMMSEDTVGFVYMLTNEKTGKSYIGKKNAWRTITRPPLKGKKKKRKSVVASDWMDYYSSGEEIARQIATHGKGIFKREILHFAQSKGALSYLELYEQVVRGVLLDDDYDNGIIQVRIAKKHLQVVREHILECTTTRGDAQ